MSRPSVRLLPETFRARLVLAFAAVVAIALALVLATLPRLLDGYFAQQEQKNLETRGRIVESFLRGQLVNTLGLDSEAPRPILDSTVPPSASDAVYAALGNRDRGFVKSLTVVVAQADVEVTITDAARPDRVAFRLMIPAESAPSPGQRRDSFSHVERFELRDTFWARFGQNAPTRLVTVRLSDPYTFRAQTLETVFGVLITAAALALFVAVVASLLLANRLTTPIRRLTQASRDLAEGDLSVRVSAPPSGSPEISELAAAFNRMAERLQESIGYIRRDRDRSREFLADVSHELRTPIAALRTFNELLRDGAAVKPATRAEFLESSRQQIDRLDWLAANLLELSKLDSGLVALDLRPDDLRAVAESAVHQAEPGARRKGIELELKLPPEPLRQRHDPQRIGQVLANLVGNGVKFTSAGGKVVLELRPTDEGAELVVSDTGVGIDPAELPHVFERFYRGAQASEASEARGGGSGLGLSIVRSIVEMHGGRVSIESRPGAGTTVVVTLPRDVSVSSPAAARA